MTPEDVATLARCCVATVRSACKSNSIPGTEARRDSAGRVSSWIIPEEAGKLWAQRYRPYDSMRKRCDATTATGTCDTVLNRRWRTVSTYLPCSNERRHVAC